MGVYLYLDQHLVDLCGLQRDALISDFLHQAAERSSEVLSVLQVHPTR